jgi:agmatine deiminase
VVELPSPRRLEHNGELLSPSYVNFYIANGAVVMPGFDDPEDEAARQAVSRLFPRREVVQVPTLELAKADGGVHCTTQQQPVA